MNKAAVCLLIWGAGLAPLRAQGAAPNRAPEKTAPLMEEDIKTAQLIKQRVAKLERVDIPSLAQEALARERQYLTGLVGRFHMPETSALTLESIRPVLQRLEAAQGRRPVAGPVSFSHSIANAFYEHDKVLAPGNPDIWAASGDNYAAQRMYQDSFRDYGQALRLGRRDARTWTGYGTAAFHMGDTRLAYRAAQSAVRADPNDRAAVSLLKLSEGRAPQVQLPDVGDAGDRRFAAGSAGSGAAVSGAQGMSPAEAAAQRPAEAPPGAVQQSAAVTAEAAAALGVKDYTHAYDLAGKAVELDARNAQAWNYKAIAENKLGRFDDAIHDASFALGLEPGNAAALQTRSWAFSKTQRYREALADANATLEKEPESSFSYYNRAFALAGLRDRDGAMASLQQAARWDRRFESSYEQARQAPQDADLVYLFDGVEPRGAVPAAGPDGGGRTRRFLRLTALSLSGGALMALGLLQLVSPRWRRRVGATLRSLAGGAPAAAGGEPGEAFWSGYTVSREIGSGGMAVVYEAMDHALARRVAIKKMRDQFRCDAQERQCFLAEARTVAALHHPNIVDIYSIVEDSGDIYLVFEYVEGQTLADMLHTAGAFTFPAARKVLKEVCAAVDYAHGQNVIHRDLKPSNIMIANDGKVKVMDFGVARRAKDAAAKLSQTQHIVGTPPYMAPEQEQCLVRKESDVFSLGVCFYEMLSLKLPFEGQGAAMLLNKINGQHLPLSPAAGGLPAGLAAVMAKALCPDPDQRYRTAGEFAAALSGLPG
ncbi:MAG: protein kinase [Elusimicrobiota bacterium]|jgi:tetratricopeptide (TPR) repeat protein/tRNA A-37 threonylcarbamoyl transferase component Bud32